MLKFLFVILACTALVNGRSSGFLNKIRAWGVDGDNVDFASLPRPDELVFQLNEEEFEDYLDFYIEAQQRTADQANGRMQRSACTVPISSLTEPQPVYVSGGRLKGATGNSGTLQFNAAESTTAACSGSNNVLTHGATTQSTASGALVCQSGNAFTGPGWLSGQVPFGSVQCRSHSPWLEARAGSCLQGGSQIAVGVQATGTRYDILTSCFHEQRAEVFYVVYDQTPENAVSQTNVARPSFQQGAWYPGLNVDSLYTQVSQKNAIASIVGSALADVYVNSTYFLARGHLAAKSEFVLSPSQRATFTFINAAPQWQPFNGGNWNTLEQTLRARIGSMGYRTRMYTGTWNILRLRDGSGTLRDIHLSPSDRKIPVPLWYYKVIHEPTTNRGIVYLGLNNPHVTLAEARNLRFCTDVCLNDSRFSWLNWRIDNIGMGYVMCCDVNDFRRTVNHLPAFTVNGLLI